MPEFSALTWIASSAISADRPPENPTREIVGRLFFFAHWAARTIFSEFPDELMVITLTGDYATRLRSYELLAAAFDLGTE